MIHHTGKLKFYDAFCNDKRKGEGREVLSIHVETCDMPKEKSLKVKGILTKFIEDELRKEMGW